MKKAIVILVSLVLSLSMLAQEKFSQQEVGITMSSLNSFGLTYKIGTEDALWRLNTMYLGANNNLLEKDSSTIENNSTRFSFAAGREWRKPINDQLQLVYGAELAYSYTKSNSDYDDIRVNYDNSYSENVSASVGINLILGVNYLLSENLSLGAELLPHFRYSMGTNKYDSSNDSDTIEETDTSTFNYGLSNTSAKLTLAFQFSSVITQALK